MKFLINIWLFASAIIGLYFAWQWNATQNPHYEPKIAILGGISTLLALWFKFQSGSSNSAYFIGGRNKVTQTTQSNEVENSTGFIGSDNEIIQK